jgi:hypothetical protein
MFIDEERGAALMQRDVKTVLCLSPAVVTLAAVAVIAALGAGPAAAQRGTTKIIGNAPEEEIFREIDPELPAYPADGALVEFQPRRNSRYRFYIDPGSVSLGTDRVVRYSVLVESPSGAANVSYEGIRCKTSEYKVYAYGKVDREWAKARDPKWQDIGLSSASYRLALSMDYFCDSETVAGRNAGDLVAILRGNPRNGAIDKGRH